MNKNNFQKRQQSTRNRGFKKNSTYIVYQTGMTNQAFGL